MKEKNRQMPIYKYKCQIKAQNSHYKDLGVGSSLRKVVQEAKQEVRRSPRWSPRRG